MPDCCNSHVANFFQDYQRQPGEQKSYWDGPANEVTGSDAPNIHKKVMPWICAIVCKNKKERINLVGHSRGGYIVMEVARELSDKGCTCPDGCTIKPRVNFLGLYDAVDMVPGYGEAETVPSNVDYAAHALRNMRSRSSFNTADGGPENKAAMKLYRERRFPGATHSGVGGSPWGLADVSPQTQGTTGR
jgi:hypothetical protein